MAIFYEDDSVRIIHGDALALELPDDSVDLVVTSPPYFGLRTYLDDGTPVASQIGAEPTPEGFVDALLAATEEMIRVLRPEGSIWINLGDRYAGNGTAPRTFASTGVDPGTFRQGARGGNRRSRPQAVPGIPPKSLIGVPWRFAIRAIDDLGLTLRGEVVWAKPNAMPESVTDRVRRVHETWFHFTLGPRYFADIDPIREPSTCDRKRGSGPRSKRSTGRGDVAAPTTSHSNPKGKPPASVWSVSTRGLKVPAELGLDHPAAFPVDLPLRIIAGWSPEDGVVLDPFGGSGTTALAARALGRTGIANDLSLDYCRIAAWRTTDPREIAIAETKGLL